MFKNHVMWPGAAQAVYLTHDTIPYRDNWRVARRCEIETEMKALA
jgi:hypothetical protein